jgi:prefoldin subunit 4
MQRARLPSSIARADAPCTQHITLHNNKPAGSNAQPGDRHIVSRESTQAIHLPSQRLLEDLEDASNEIMLADEEQTRFVVGGCFIHLENDDAEERLQSATDKTKEEIEQHEAELEELEGKMSKLKAVLYSKFGKSINLEEDAS